MSDNEELLERLRIVCAEHDGVVEQAMVGGRSFALDGRMFCGVTRAGLMVRVGRAAMTAALREEGVSPMTLGGRALAAFVIVAPEAIVSGRTLAAWVQRALDDLSAPDPSRAQPRSRHHASVGSAKGAEPAIPLGSAARRFAELAEHFARSPDVTLPEQTARRFGSSALKVRGSIFAMLSRDHLVVKLPAARVRELIEAGKGEPFSAGRAAPMQQWLAVTTDEPSTWLALTREAHLFVSR